MHPTAELKHALAMRTRIRVRGKRGDPEYFSYVVQELEKLSVIHEVQANDQTGSILINHGEGAREKIIEHAQSNGLFTLEESPQGWKPMLQEAAAGLSNMDVSFNRVTGGSLDFRSVLYVTLIIMTLVQIMRGQIFAPAATMFWYAIDLLGYIRAKGPGAR
jgi:hypothetical protein